MLGMTLPQAAATLAATIIGFNIGLFDQSVVNAVLVLILVTIVLATLITDRAKTRVAVPHVDHQALGKRVLVALQDPGQAQIGFTIAARVAGPGQRPGPGTARMRAGRRSASARPSLRQLHRVGFAVGVDVDPGLLVHPSLAEGIINVVAEHEPSLVLVGQRTASAHPALGGVGEAVAASVPMPVAILIGEGGADRRGRVGGRRSRARGGTRTGTPARRRRWRRCWRRGSAARTSSAEELSDKSALGDLRPGQLCIAPVDSWQVMAAADPPDGAALMMVLQPPALVPHDERSSPERRRHGPDRVGRNGQPCWSQAPPAGSVAGPRCGWRRPGGT